MAFDGIVLRAVIDELNYKITGGRIDKIYQPLSRDLLFILRSQGHTYRLLLSANPSHSRVYLTERYKGQNPTEPPMFCMLLRKHFEGGRITNIHQVDNERIMVLTVENRDELGDISEKQLIVEIMGRHSNIILVEPTTGKILDGIVHVNFGTSRHREVLPGRDYVAPPEQNKISPFAETSSGFLEKRKENTLPFQQFLVKTYSGISPLLGREIEHRLQKEDMQNEWDAFNQFLSPLREHSYSPTLVKDEGGKPKAFSAVRLTHEDGQIQTYDSISACLEHFFEEKSWRDTLQQKAGDMERVLLADLERDRNKIIKFKEAIQDADQADKYRIWGELLTGSLHQLEKGITTARVTNFYDVNLAKVEIPMDPKRSPQENAQAYFKKYNKVKKSIPILKEQIQQTSEQIAYLESVLQLLSMASLNELEEIREELEQEGILKSHKKSRGFKKKKQGSIQLEHFRSSDGIDIYVGKNNKQNDYLTMKFAHSADTWLHTKDIPGSHVVIRSKEVPEKTLLEAARLAAYFSKAKESSQVPVDYTLIKHVWKPNGAKPGMVLFKEQKTLYVTPDPSLVNQLQQN